MRLSMPGLLLRLEGAAVLTLAVFLYTRLGGGWLLFAALILAPDLAMLGYLVNVGVGSAVYNLIHTYVVPAGLLAFAWLSDATLGILVAFIWFAHIGADRMLGFGLKYPTEFKDTHLNRV